MFFSWIVKNTKNKHSNTTEILAKLDDNSNIKGSNEIRIKERE